jgi:hypothetical protein
VRVDVNAFGELRTVLDRTAHRAGCGDRVEARELLG